ncbi:MAG TPA: nitroreductase family protein [Caldisericia bacterium]|nr:nitroreductase family protein [Caldisericia bacterium]
MLELLLQRRSIRHYQEKRIEKEKIETIQKCVLLSPSSRNRRPWEFFFVTDPSLIENLSISKPHGSSFLREAPLAIVVVGLPEVSDAWIEDCSITSIIAQLAAEGIGLSSCWIQIREREHNDNQSAAQYIQTLLEISDDKEIEAIIAVGYSAEEKDPYTEEELDFQKITNIP